MNDSPVGKDSNDPDYRVHIVKGADDQKNDPLGSLQKADLALRNERLSSSSGVTRHHRSHHDHTHQHDVSHPILLAIPDDQPKIHDEIRVSIHHRIKEGTEGGFRVGVPCHHSVDHVEKSGDDQDHSGRPETTSSEGIGCDNTHHKSQKSEVIWIDAKKNECLDDDSQNHLGAGANALRNHSLLKNIQFDG